MPYDGSAPELYNIELLRRIRVKCVEQSTSIPKIEKALGYGNGSISGWAKAKRRAPMERVEAVAGYLGCDVSDLIPQRSVASGSGLRLPTVPSASPLNQNLDLRLPDNKKPASDIADGDDVISILQDLRSRPELKMLFDAGRKATPETVRKTARFLEELAKGENSD